MLWILLLGALAPGAAPDDITPAPPATPILVRLSERGRPDGGRAETSLTLDESGHARWEPGAAFSPSFGERLDLDLERDPGRPEAPLDVFLEWMTTGPEDPARRFRVDVRALDAAGAELFHTWEIQADNRIGPREIPFGTRVGVRSLTNSARCKVPAWALPKLAAVAVELAVLRDADLHHVAPRPSDVGLAMTRPDADGRFTIAFTNPHHGRPDAWPLDPSKHQAVVVLSAPAAGGQPASRAVRPVDVRAEGSYRVPFRLPPAQMDEARVMVVFLSRQPEHDAFVRRFFAEGQGGGYSGLWHQSGAPLIEVPFADEVEIACPAAPDPVE